MGGRPGRLDRELIGLAAIVLDDDVESIAGAARNAVAVVVRPTGLVAARELVE